MRFRDLRLTIDEDTIVLLKNEAGSPLGLCNAARIPKRYDGCIVKIVSVQFMPGLGSRPVLMIIIG